MEDMELLSELWSKSESLNNTNSHQMTVSGASGERLKKELGENLKRLRREQKKKEDNHEIAETRKAETYNYVGFLLWSAAIVFFIFLLKELLQADFGVGDEEEL